MAREGKGGDRPKGKAVDTGHTHELTAERVGSLPQGSSGAWCRTSLGMVPAEGVGGWGSCGLSALRHQRGWPWEAFSPPYHTFCQMAEWAPQTRETL